MDTLELGLQVREARRLKKMKQRDLADAAGVSLGTIQNLESGKRETHPATVVRVRQVLEMPGDEAKARSTWPPDVQAILDVIGTWLSTIDESQRLEFHREMVRRAFGITDAASTHEGGRGAEGH